jgi:hypothetical protein
VSAGLHEDDGALRRGGQVAQHAVHVEGAGPHVEVPVGAHITEARGLQEVEQGQQRKSELKFDIMAIIELF